MARPHGAPGPGPGLAAPSHLLYLHGFRSSPASFKARRLAAWHAARPAGAAPLHWCCPQLPPSPAAAWRLITSLVAGWPAPLAQRLAVVGSSLGGYYATALAEATGCRAVLLNPAVDPARDLAAHIGEHTQFHTPDQRFFFRPEYIGELRALAVPALTQPERYAAIIAQGDEVLSWQEMHRRHALPGAHVALLPGSDHGLSDFDTHLPWVLDWLQLR